MRTFECYTTWRMTYYSPTIFISRPLLLLNFISSFIKSILCLWLNTFYLSYKCAKFHERHNQVMNSSARTQPMFENLNNFLKWISLIKEKYWKPFTLHSTKENRDVEEWNKLSSEDQRHVSNMRAGIRYWTTFLSIIPNFLTPMMLLVLGSQMLMHIIKKKEYKRSDVSEEGSKTSRPSNSLFMPCFSLLGLNVG